MYLLDKIVEYGRRWLVEPLTSVFTGSRLTWKKRSSPYPDDSLPTRKKIKTVDVATMTNDQLPEVGAIQVENAEETQDELAIDEEVAQPAQVLLQFPHVQQAAVDFFGQELIQVAQHNLAMEGAQDEDSANEDSDDESEDEEVQEDAAPFQENLLILHLQAEDNAEDHQDVDYDTESVSSSSRDSSGTSSEAYGDSDGSTSDDSTIMNEVDDAEVPDAEPDVLNDSMLSEQMDGLAVHVLLANGFDGLNEVLDGHEPAPHIRPGEPPSEEPSSAEV